MSDVRKSPPKPPARPLWEPLLLLLAVAGIGVFVLRQPDRGKQVAPIEVVPEAPTVAVAAAPSEPEVVVPEPALDRAAIAAAEARVAEAEQARLAAEAQAATAAEALRQAELNTSTAALSVKSVASKIKDPRARLASIQTRGGVLRDETTRIAAELNSLASAPRPRRKVLSDRTPVARPVEGNEYHFELRGNRVAFIDLDRLVDKLEADAKLQIRLSMGSQRTITSEVGPVGAFSMRYILSAVAPMSAASLLGGTVSYDLSGWEIVPFREARGETLDAIAHPASEFAQVINTLNPGRETITLWVYPDAFGTFRQLKAYLHQRGFQIAARPLPNGVAIRGSPSGSLSAGQ